MRYKNSWGGGGGGGATPIVWAIRDVPPFGGQLLIETEIDGVDFLKLMRFLGSSIYKVMYL